jgi:hypothetical protein
LIPLLIAATSLASPVQAQEYQRARVYDPDGPYLFWRTRDVTFTLDARGCPDTDLGQTRAAVVRSFNTWESQPCTDIFFVYDGIVEGAEPNTISDTADGINLVTWLDEWPGEWGDDQLAHTNFVWNELTGEILDVDIVLNGQDYYWTAGDITITDIEDVLTHEIGHLLGFSHSTDPDATMYAGYVEGEIEKRDLAATDIQGLCEVYPAGQPTPDVPDLGLNQQELSSGGCQCSATPEPPAAWALACLLSPLVLAAARRRR